METFHALTNAMHVILGIVKILVISAVIFRVVTTQRQMASKITWFPEAFLRTTSGTRRRSRRRGPEGQELRKLGHNNTSLPVMDMERMDAGYFSDHTAITDYEEVELRQQHLDAADIRGPSMLTQPQAHDVNDINARGPCGMSRIMVAAVKGGGIDTGEDGEYDSAGATIQDLVAQGAELNATIDKTGETLLHLAAHYARAEASKLLLEAGACKYAR
ncbi:hypothetical protein WA026_016589 [Henosepilachna vigintioctopunctata]|uniref:Uncharacterized protein n=1 Tax=Henosepilachna vigintioctopunctata TaxID=420089 RepID=A0AAW1VDZ5_9CUCU